MYQVQDWAEVHRLFHREGWAKAKIAEKLGYELRGHRLELYGVPIKKGG